MQLSIVSFLDKYATEEVRHLQKALGEVTGSTASLTSWLPHITLGDGIDIEESELTNTIEELNKVVSSIPTFSVTISGFSS